MIATHQNAMDPLHPQYLKKRYGHLYRVVRAEDGIWVISTRFVGRDGLSLDVSVFSETHLAALLPLRVADGLLKDFPDDFTLRQNASDCKVVLFKEEDLGKFTDRLKLRLRRRLSPEARERARETLRPYYFSARHRPKTVLESANAPSMG